MSIFIDPSATLPVTHEDFPDDTIYVKSRIDFQTYARIEEALMKLEVQTSARSNNGRTDRDGEDVTVGARYTLSGQKMALLAECISDWDGPLFTDERGRKIPCNRRNINLLDPHHPLVERALEVIDERNRPTTEAPPKGKKAEGPKPSESST